MIRADAARFVRGLLLSLVVALAGSARLARAEPTSLSEAEFLRRFAAASPRLEASRAEVDVARANVRRAGVRENPALGYDREEVFAGGDRAAENVVRLSWPLELSGRRSRSVAAAETGVRAAEHEVAAETAALVTDALDRFHTAAFLRLRVAILRDGRAGLASALQATRSRRAAGDAAGYDVDRLELELGDYDDLLAEAGAGLAAARLELARLVGDPDGVFDAATDLELPAAPGPLADVLASALSTRSDHEAARLRAQQAGRERDAAGRGWIPGLVLSGGVKTSDLGGQAATGYVAGIALGLPLFDRGGADRDRAAAEHRRWTATARALAQEIDGEVRAAHERLARRVEQARRYREVQLPRAAEIVRRAEGAYREGDRPLFELLDAYRTAREVRLRELELRRAARRAELDLRRALGRRP